LLKIGQFLVQNYQQALDIIWGEDILKQQMQHENINDQSVFVEWLAEECEYLTGLNQEPIDETMAMDYYQSLVDIVATEYVTPESMPLIFLNFIFQGSHEGYSQYLPSVFYRPFGNNP
jgi:hypothetical protein